MEKWQRNVELSTEFRITDEVNKLAYGFVLDYINRNFNS